MLALLYDGARDGWTRICVLFPSTVPSTMALGWGGFKATFDREVGIWRIGTSHVGSWVLPSVFAGATHVVVGECGECALVMMELEMDFVVFHPVSAFLP